MDNRAETISDWCNTLNLPQADSLYKELIGSDGKFIPVEGLSWDFKDEWPFSLSDEYFGGIARLICAFANTVGGAIIFGVHDSKRDGGHNKVRINVDKFAGAVADLIGSKPLMDVASYTSTDYGDVDVLFVSRRSQGEPPYAFQRRLGKYEKGIIWSRRSHEVIRAGPPQFPTLFFGEIQAYDVDGYGPLDGSLPPSPAKLKRFVGRTQVMSKLFDWLQNSDEPRTYLHGKGGSGKTTIAYEFSRLMREYGGALRLYSADPVDAVLFISAKEKSLDSVTGTILEVDEPDFSNERELLIVILYYGGWTRDKDYLYGLSNEKLRSEAREFFDITSLVLVIDDVDTLTTKNIDPGSDFLYRTLCRSSRVSKVIYTLRNAPSQSLTNSIEVPGLEGDDYDAFVDECVSEFGVMPPSVDFRENVLPEISERRPLVIESIIALVRTGGSYERAVELFSQHAGDDVRQYVFAREWDAVRGDGLAKLLLAALADLAESASFADLQAVLQADASRIRDAIGAVREMFLQVDQTGADALYSLAPLTRSFVESRKRELVGYGVLAERVKAYRRHSKISNPRVAAIVSQVERLLPRRYNEHNGDKVSEAYRIVTDRNLPHAVTEDPLFRSVLGYVCCLYSNPRLAEARDAFEYAISMKYEPEFGYLRAWFSAEKSSGANDGWCIRIAELIIGGKKYDSTEKMIMVGRKAASLYARGKERSYTDVVDAIADFKESLKLHLKAFRMLILSGDDRANVSENYARNTAFQLFALANQSGKPWELSDLIVEIVAVDEIYLDPIQDPIESAFSSIHSYQHRPEVLARWRNRLRLLIEACSENEKWLADSLRKRVCEALEGVDRVLREQQRTRQGTA